MRRLAAIGLAALAFPGAAFAHASLLTARPAVGGRVSAAPRLVRLEFSQPVTVTGSSIVVYDARGRTVSLRPAGSGKVALVRLGPRLGRGGYTVRWHVLSGDAHVISGVYTFGVRAAAPPVTEAWGAGGPTAAERIVRWGYFVALALVLGGLFFRLALVPRRMPAAYERRFFQVTGLGVVAAAEIGIVAFLLRADDALQLPFGRLLYGDLTPLANGTRFGHAFIAMTLGLSVVAALLFLAWLTERRGLLWPALVLGLGLASGLSLSGHSAVDEGASRWSELADWVHLCAATLWVGGLVQLAVCVWPLAREERSAAFLRFARLAPVLIAVIVAAGTYLTILRLPTVADLWSAGYGRVLLVKLGLVVVALAWGGFHHFVVRPRLERPGAGRVRRSLLGESAVAMAILLAAAVLVESQPPEPPDEPAQAVQAR